MTLAKPAKTETPLPASGPTRKPSGHNGQRPKRRTVMLQIRVAPALADKARAMAADRAMTLGQILQAGVETLAELGE